MASTAIYTVKIDSLPEETVEAESPQEAARKAGALIADHESLRRLHDEEPVEIKRPDGRPWGRNLTIGRSAATRSRRTTSRTVRCIRRACEVIRGDSDCVPPAGDRRRGALQA